MKDVPKSVGAESSLPEIENFYKQMPKCHKEIMLTGGRKGLLLGNPIVYEVFLTEIK